MDDSTLAKLGEDVRWVPRWVHFWSLLSNGIGFLGLAVWSWTTFPVDARSERMRRAALDWRESSTILYVVPGALSLLLAVGLGWWLAREGRAKREGRWG